MKKHVFKQSKKLATLLVGGLALSACVSTQHVPYGARDESTLNLNRTVEYETTDGFYLDAPECVTILPMETGGQPRAQIHDVLEDAVARYMRMKMTNVIDRVDRQILTRRLAVDLSHPADRRAFARGARCDHFVRISPWGSGKQYLLFWNREALGIEVSLESYRDSAPLWKARHVASRSDGGLPLNPISAIFSAYEANSLAADQDVPMSLADDVARHIVATLPGMRRSQYATGNSPIYPRSSKQTASSPDYPEQR